MRIRLTMECTLSDAAAALLAADRPDDCRAALRAALGRAELAVKERRARALMTGEPRLTPVERESLLGGLGTEQAVLGALLRSLEVEVTR